MRKHFLAFLMVVVLLAGCCFAAQAEDPITLRVAWWGSQARHDLTVAAIDKFMEKYPNIKVEVEFADFSGYWSRLATQVAGGLAPDVLQMGYVYINQYVKNGVVEELTPYVESGALDIGDVSESMIASGRVQDGLYAIACGSNCPILMYRKDILDAAGVTMPLMPTESEFWELEKKVFEATGRTNGSMTNWENGMRTILRCYGLNLYNEEETALGFDDPSYIVYMWERYLREVESGVKLGVGESTAATAYDEYVSDNWGTGHFSNELSAYETGSGCELELAAQPTMDDAPTPHTYFKPTMYWSIAKTSKQKEAAITFINYFTNDPDCYDIVGMDRGIPVSASVREYLSPKLDESSKKVVAIMDYLSREGNSSPVMKPDVSCHSEINALFASYFEQVQYGLVDDLTAHAKAFMDEANGIITKSLAE